MWQRLKAWARALKNDGMTLWFCCRHPRMPRLLKFFALLVVGYFLSPIDLIPDFIPVIGFADELVIVPLVLWHIRRMIPAEVWAEYFPPRGRQVISDDTDEHLV